MQRGGRGRTRARGRLRGAARGMRRARAGCGKLYRARSRLYRSQILQANIRWKALAEIYRMHSFAPFSWDPSG